MVGIKQMTWHYNINLSFAYLYEVKNYVVNIIHKVVKQWFFKIIIQYIYMYILSLFQLLILTWISSLENKQQWSIYIYTCIYIWETGTATKTVAIYLSLSIYIYIYIYIYIKIGKGLLFCDSPGVSSVYFWSLCCAAVDSSPLRRGGPSAGCQPWSAFFCYRRPGPRCLRGLLRGLLRAPSSWPFGDTEPYA